jgi:hypothetical protein
LHLLKKFNEIWVFDEKVGEIFIFIKKEGEMCVFDETNRRKQVKPSVIFSHTRAKMAPPIDINK